MCNLISGSTLAKIKLIKFWTVIGTLFGKARVSDFLKMKKKNYYFVSHNIDTNKYNIKVDRSHWTQS